MWKNIICPCTSALSQNCKTKKKHLSFLPAYILVYHFNQLFWGCKTQKIPVSWIVLNPTNTAFLYVMFLHIHDSFSCMSFSNPLLQRKQNLFAYFQGREVVCFLLLLLLTHSNRANRSRRRTPAMLYARL